MASHKSRWDKTKEFHYDQFDQIANENAYRAAEAFDREFVANVERINGRTLSFDEKIGGYVKRKDTRDLIEKSKADIWQPVKAKDNSPTAKYDSLIASLNNDVEAKYLEAAKIVDDRKALARFAEIEREKVLASQAVQAAGAELQESKILQQLKQLRESIRYNGTVDERIWSAIDRAIRQAEFVGGCPLETAALYEQATALWQEHVMLQVFERENRVAELQSQIREIRGDTPASEPVKENPYAVEAYQGLSEVQGVLNES